jgi:hypothetical protein
LLDISRNRHTPHIVILHFQFTGSYSSQLGYGLCRHSD